MTTLIAAFILSLVFVTSVVSGIFGMAGGLIMKGALVSLLPVATSMVLHGAIQIVSNLFRAALWWRHISWPVARRYAVGAALAVAALFLLSWRPTQTEVFFLLGLTAMLVQVPRSVIEISAERPYQAEICGLAVQVLNTLAGVAGPLLDIFFVKTALARQTVVATKAATQVLAHAVKIGFWSLPLVAAAIGDGDSSEARTFPPLWLFLCLVPLSLAGTWLGGRLLERITDQNFRSWTKWIVTATGCFYLFKGLTTLAT